MGQDNRVPMRHVRVSDDLWDRAMWAARYRGDKYVSYIIRRFLTQYVEETESMVEQARRKTRAPNRGANQHARPPRPRKPGDGPG